MRNIEFYVLRLLVDPAAPDQCCGALQSISTDANYLFKNEQELLGLIKRLARESVPEESLKEIPAQIFESNKTI